MLIIAFVAANAVDTCDSIGIADTRIERNRLGLVVASFIFPVETPHLLFA